MKTYAGFWQRIAAFMWDYLVIVGYIVVITGILWLVHAPEWLFINRVQSQVSGILVLTIPVILYFAISESSTRQGTWGKNRQSLTVADKNGNRIQFGRAFARAALKFAPWEIAHTLIWEISYFPDTNPILINTGFALVYGLVGLNIASLLMTKNHQTVYDLITSTYVINNQKDQP